MYHGLRDDFRPLRRPDLSPRLPQNVDRYRHLIYGFARAVEVIEFGASGKPPAVVMKKPTNAPPT